MAVGGAAGADGAWDASCFGARTKDSAPPAVAAKGGESDDEKEAQPDSDGDEVMPTLPSAAAMAAPGAGLIGLPYAVRDAYGSDREDCEVPWEKGSSKNGSGLDQDLKSAAPGGGYLSLAQSAALLFPSCTTVSVASSGYVVTGSSTAGLCSNVANDLSPPSPVIRRQPRALILFDWDDTLCPTSWIEDHPELRRLLEGPITTVSNSPRVKSGESWESLAELARAVAQLVNTALAHGSVALVTLAQRPWVPVAIRDFMPSVGTEVARLEVFYAREQGVPFGEPHGSCPWTTMKRRAMQEAMNVMESRDGDRQWDSFISIGDSAVEQRAAQQLGRECLSRGTVKWTKTVKLGEHPGIAQLIDQVHAITDQIADFVAHPGNKNVNIAEWMQNC